MPIPEPLASLTTDPTFWAAYLPPVAGPAPAHHAQTRVVLPVADGYGLVLEIDLGYGECLLGLRQPGASEPLPLARLDPGRPYAAVLRWAELDLIGRLLALDDPAWPHPGLLVALLHRYAPPAGDPPAADRAATMLATALRALRRDEPSGTEDPATPDGPATSGDGPAGEPGVADASATTAGPVQPPLELFADPSWWPAPATVDPRILDDESVARQVRDHLDHGARTHWRYAVGWGWVAAGQPDGPGAPARVLGAESFPFDEITELVRRAAARHRRLLDTPWRRTPAVAELARRARDTGDLAVVPVLGRTLAEAGCDHPTLLDALTEPVVPAEAAWVVDALSGIVPADDDGR
ncbi:MULTISPECIES: hypothetical protein [unclassified Solwaraspora]|uniref:hypothetical protein n=1 Tax=unclassified Solwaraspora TaxID=2627926 RepID=UPI00248BB69C|nr:MULTISPECIES: hypothetical protein [unclassified Solwaraspora]WBB96836.1 hypothetical protein O7553_26765 [Solwaraspora sp. WMMA2059]WBC19259.1 hypothetical protein O7543_20600 [Solwaraspora sp. WMMA2080]WJK33297.1 hypothetical protein O7610_21740 [Solwaraspora sp. WMMA2065]